MLEHVWERATKSRYLTDVVVATDDDRIAAVVRKFGGRVRMTSSQHATGTDRLAEVASAEEAALYVNIQGDEPLIDPDAIDAAILSVDGDETVAMGTLKRQIFDPTDIVNTNVVKVLPICWATPSIFRAVPFPMSAMAAARRRFTSNISGCTCIGANFSFTIRI